MNIILEKREEIIRENNTGQAHLINLLDKLSRKIEILQITEALHGDLDFSIFVENGFTDIHTIILPEGEITSLQNIPTSVETLICPRNYLVSLDDLPTSITHLEIPYNYLTEYHFANTPYLQIFNVSNNRVEHLENFSLELIELQLQSNKLAYLDLKCLYKLEKINISNNIITIIENLPENIRDFIMENTPSIEFRNSTVLPEIEPDLTDEQSAKQNINYMDALYKYFSLKSKYDKSIKKMKKEAFKSTNSKKEGKALALEIKPKCIKCKKPVGTLFFKENDRYKAICGDTNQPCTLNIEIFNGSYASIRSLLYLFKEEMDNLKDIIVQQKMDTLFSYVPEDVSIDLLKKNIESFNYNSMMFKELLNKYNENHFNSDKQEIIYSKRERIFKLIEQIRLLLNEYEGTENIGLLKAAVQIQANDLLPETRNLRLLESELIEVNLKKHTNGKIEYFLFKNDVVLSKEDFSFGEPSRVIKFQSTK
jgi:hypothetical protein